MKKCLAFLLAILFPSWGLAAPFLACTPSTAAISNVEVQVTRNNDTSILTGTYNIVGGDALLLDLSGYQPGQYEFRTRWKTATGWWSDWSAPFLPEKPVTPGSMKLVQ